MQDTERRSTLLGHRHEPDGCGVPRRRPSVQTWPLCRGPWGGTLDRQGGSNHSCPRMPERGYGRRSLIRRLTRRHRRFCGGVREWASQPALGWYYRKGSSPRPCRSRISSGCRVPCRRPSVQVWPLHRRAWGEALDRQGGSNHSCPRMTARVWAEIIGAPADTAALVLSRLVKEWAPQSALGWCSHEA